MSSTETQEPQPNVLKKKKKLPTANTLILHMATDRQQNGYFKNTNKIKSKHQAYQTKQMQNKTISLAHASVVDILYKK